MPKKDPDALHSIKNEFNAKLRHPTYESRYDNAKYIRADLKDQGYDLNDDATYELLEPGLTKAKFNELAHVADSYFVTSQFYFAMHRQQKDDWWHEAQMKYFATGELIFRLDRTHATFKAKPLPADVDPHHKHIFNFIMDEYESGRLQEYHKDLAVPYLVEAFDMLQRQWGAAQKFDAQGKSDSSTLSTHLKKVKEVGDTVAAMTQPRRDTFLQQANTSEAALQSMQRDIAVMFARTTIAKNPVIPVWEPIHMAYQEALEALDSAGVDLNAQSTYDAIGMDRQTFWGNYHKQIEWNKTEGKVYGLPKKIFTPAP